MPRNEDMVYSLPAGTEAVTGTTIESAKYNMVLRDLEAEANAPRPIAAGGTGTNSLAGLQALVGYSVDSIASLVASSTEYPVGATLQARQGGTTYRVVAANGQHVTAGGVHLIESGPMFTSRDRLRAAIAAGAVAQGQAVQVSGIGYVVDSAATGMASALWDVGVNGIRTDARPINAYVAAFHDLNDPRIVRIYSSADGLSWSLLSSLPLQSDTGSVINGGNPVIAYRDGWFYMLVSYASLGDYDFRIYKTRDFTAFDGPYNRSAGPTPIGSATNPAPGGTVPANEIWGADMTFTPEGQLHVLISVPFGPEKADVRGRLVGDRRMFRTVCTNLSTLTFASPTLETLPAGHAPRLYQSTTGPLLAPTFPLNHQTNAGAGTGGFEVGFAEQFQAAFPLDDLIIVPVAKGGTGFVDGEWIVGGPAYAEAITRIRAVRDANPGAIIEGVLWHQGEADRAGTAATYQSQMNALAGRFRSSIPELAGKPFIFGEIGRFVTGDTIGVNAILANAVAATTVAGLASSEGLTDRGDGLHFNSPSYRALGKRYWDAFKALRGSVGSGVSPVKRIIIIAGQSNAAGWSPYETPSMIDASITRTPGRWLMSVKDSTQQIIRIYNGAAITGPWVFQETVGNPSYAIEGSSIVPRRLASGAVAWDLFVEGHNTLPDWTASQRIMVYRGGTTTGGWGDIAPTFVRSTRGIRHGTPLNLGFEDPAAYQAFQRFAAVAAGDVDTSEIWRELSGGSRSIAPQEGIVYYVTADTVTNLTILDGQAQEFFLAVLSTNPAAGINVLWEGYVAGSAAIGFGLDNNRIVRLRKRDGGLYHIEAGAGRAMFSAHRDGADQSVSVATPVKVNFPTIVVNAGGAFAGSTWTPPAGRYDIRAGVLFSGAASGETNRLQIRRNGTVVRQSLSLTSSGSNSLSVSCIVTANGTDTFEVFVEFPGGGTKVISGGLSNTWFEGVSA